MGKEFDFEAWVGKQEDKKHERFEKAIAHAGKYIGDTDFYESCVDQYLKKKWLSDKQVECLLSAHESKRWGRAYYDCYDGDPIDYYD